MKNFNDLLEKLNNLRIIQKSIDWEECLPEEIWNEYFKGKCKELTSRLDVDTHRWYETSISVINIYDCDKLLGIRHITNLFSESSSCEDCYVTLKFFEMREITITSYEIIENSK